MTREEQILKAAKAEIPETYDFSEPERSAFLAGANWADEHPKSLLIKLEDKMPEEGQVILVFHQVTSSLNGETDTQITPMVCRYMKGLLKTTISHGIMGVVSESKFIYWMPIPPIPDKQ